MQVPQGPLVHLDRLVRPELEAEVEQQELPVLQVPVDRVDPVDPQGLLAQVEQQVQVDHQDHLAPRVWVLLELQVQVVQAAQLAQELLAQQVLLDRQAQAVHLGQVAPVAHQDQPQLDNYS